MFQIILANSQFSSGILCAVLCINLFKNVIGFLLSGTDSLLRRNWHKTPIGCIVISKSYTGNYCIFVLLKFSML